MPSEVVLLRQILPMFFTYYTKLLPYVPYWFRNQERRSDDDISDGARNSMRDRYLLFFLTGFDMLSFIRCPCSSQYSASWVFKYLTIFWTALSRAMGRIFMVKTAQIQVQMRWKAAVQG
jgi:hypothetical protein